MVNATEKILQRLARADREHQKERGGCFLFRAVKYLLALVLALVFLDVVLNLNAAWRFGLGLSFAGLILGLVTCAWYLAYVRRNRLEHIARWLEIRGPEFGSRLINLLQLRSVSRDESLAPLTRELAVQAVENYAQELQSTDLEHLARTGALRGCFRRAAGITLGWVTLWALFFPITRTEWARFLDPFGDHPPFSFTRLEIVVPGPTGTNVLYGKGLVVKVKASGHAPKEVFLVAHPPEHPEQAVKVPMFDKGQGNYDQLLDNLRTELVVTAQTRNQSSLSKQAHIGLILTPKLEQAFVEVSPPAYTGLKPEEKAYSFAVLQALQGSQVRFRLQSNRPLRDGWIELQCADHPPQRLPLSRANDQEVTGAFVAQDSGRLRFGLVDATGLPSQDDWAGSLTVTYDLTPEIRIVEPERDTLVAQDFKLLAQFEASDDYGLHRVRLHRALNGVYSAPRLVTYEPPVRHSAESVEFDLPNLGVQPGDVISLFAEAVDSAPQPHVARSQTVRLQIISVEDYNNILREQSDLAEIETKYATLLDDLADLIEKQQKLSEAAQQLKSQLQSAGDTNREEFIHQFDGLMAQQNELNAQLNRQAERWENFVRPDPIYDVERDLQERLRQEATAIRQSTQTNEAALRQLAARSSPTAGPRQVAPDLADDFKQAADDQAARLGAARQSTESEVAQVLEEMSLMQELQKDFSQFEALYKTQQELAAHTQAYNRPGQLTREDQLALQDLAANEKQVGDLLEQLEDKLQADAKAAEKLFPKAAKSGRDLAQAMAQLRLQSLARQATGQMLAGNGERSFGLADRLRGEMEKLFRQCQGGNCPSNNELDSYLTLQRSLNPGRNFAQMARSRKFDRPGGMAKGTGIGEGSMGTSGYAVMVNADLAVMGNEASPRRGQSSARQSNRLGQGIGAPSPAGPQVEVSQGESMRGLNPVNRQTGAVASEASLEEYTDLVDSYFKAITTRKTP